MKVEAERQGREGTDKQEAESFFLPKSKNKSLKVEGESPDPVETAKRECECALRALDVRVLARHEVSAMTEARCEVLDQDAFGSCIKTQHSDTGAPLVIKILYDGDLCALLQEASNLFRLQVKGMQRLVGVCLQDVQIVSQLCRRGGGPVLQPPSRAAA